MSESANNQLVKQLYEALHSDDLDSFLEMCSPDIQWQYPEAAGIPYGGLRRGRAGVVEFFELHDQADEILDLSPNEFIAQGDQVVVLGSYRGRARPTDREWQSEFVHVFTIDDARIARFQVFFNTAAFLEAHRR